MDEKLFLAKYGTKKHLDQLIDNKEHKIRYNIAKNPNTTTEHLDKLINDKDRDVRYHAKDELEKRFPR